MIKEKIKNGEGFIEVEGVIYTAKEWDEMTDPKWNKTAKDYQKKSDQAKIDFADNPVGLEERMQELSNNLKKTRKAMNPDYLENQKKKITKIFSQHDYKIVDNKLVLLTEPEKLDIAKERKKKDIALQLTQLYPEKVIDGTLKVLSEEKNAEIDLLKEIKYVEEYRI
jgi:hypothetical protein